MLSIFKHKHLMMAAIVSYVIAMMYIMWEMVK